MQADISAWPTPRPPHHQRVTAPALLIDIIGPARMGTRRAGMTGRYRLFEASLMLSEVK